MAVNLDNPGHQRTEHVVADGVLDERGTHTPRPGAPIPD
jgi:hypothetical protein